MQCNLPPRECIFWGICDWEGVKIGLVWHPPIGSLDRSLDVINIISTCIPMYIYIQNPDTQHYYSLISFFLFNKTLCNKVQNICFGLSIFVSFAEKYFSILLFCLFFWQYLLFCIYLYVYTYICRLIQYNRK